MTTAELSVPADAISSSSPGSGTATPVRQSSQQAAADVELSPVMDADWPEVLRMQFLAMEDDCLALKASPHHLRPDLDTRIEWSLYTQRRVPPAVFSKFAYVKATSASQPDRVLGLAVWERPPTTVDPTATPAATESAEPLNEELEARIAATKDTEFLKGFKDRAKRTREAHAAGKPFWYLSLLVVHPEAQGLGIGRKLILWGTDQADAAGLACYCESSPIGEKVYPRYGFEAIKYDDWTLFDGQPTRSPSFYRPPKTA